MLKRFRKVAESIVRYPWVEISVYVKVQQVIKTVAHCVFCSSKCENRVVPKIVRRKRNGL